MKVTSSPLSRSVYACFQQGLNRYPSVTFFLWRYISWNLRTKRGPCPHARRRCCVIWLALHPRPAYPHIVRKHQPCVACRLAFVTVQRTLGHGCPQPNVGERWWKGKLQFTTGMPHQLGLSQANHLQHIPKKMTPQQRQLNWECKEAFYIVESGSK